MRQFLTESLVLAVSGGAIGLILAGWGTRFVAGLFRENQNPIVINAQPDGTVLLFAAGLSVLTGIVFGLAPAFGATRLTLAPALKTGSAGHGACAIDRRAGTHSSPDKSRSCLVLTFGAALLVRTLQNLQRVDGGFDTENVLVFALDARDTAFPAERVAGLCSDVLDRIRATARRDLGLLLDDEPDRHGDGRTRPRAFHRRHRASVPTTPSSPTR